MTVLYPRFSIIVPTHSRPERLRLCLAALARLDYPRDRFEVIVVDDGGDHPLAEIVATVAGQIDLTLVRQPNAGPAAARNHGARRAGADYLVFTDDDCAPAPDWLLCFARCLVARPTAMIGGHTINALSHNVFSQASQSLIGYLYRYYEAEPAAGFLATNNLAMPAPALRAMGGFDQRYPRAAGEDRDLCDRWTAAGGEICYVPEAVVRHYHALGLPSFWRQHYNYGRGAYLFRRNRTRNTRRKSKIEFERLGFYTGLLGYPFRVHRLADALPIAALFALSQLATVCGFVAQGWQNRERGRKPAP